MHSPTFSEHLKVRFLRWASY